ncbi:gp180 [Listeria phage A511]|uniref:Gp180 n=2 Tax=Pecentumvirus TaxID=1857844 RepID=A8AT14_BPA51|nr:gp180 [Listeria phage A511]AAY52961.1 gp180 [Listeria phage A511]AII27407.1 hypothetical protein [Listeria phage LMTA-34]
MLNTETEDMLISVVLNVRSYGVAVDSGLKKDIKEMLANKAEDSINDLANKLNLNTDYLLTVLGIK